MSNWEHKLLKGESPGRQPIFTILTVTNYYTKNLFFAIKKIF